MIGSNSAIVAQDDVRVQEIRSLINELESVSSGGGVAMATRSQDIERFHEEYSEYSKSCHSVNRVLARQILLNIVSTERAVLPLFGTGGSYTLMAVQLALFTLSGNGLSERASIVDESFADMFQNS